MPTPSQPPGTERVLSSNADFQVAARVLGNWLFVLLRGHYDDRLLTALRTQVFTQRMSLAIDVSGLTGITTTLARELYLTAGRMKSTKFRLALVNPNEKVLSLISLLAPGARLPSFAAPEELPPDPLQMERQLERADKEREQIRAGLRANPLWQHVDREGHWLCPFCAKTVDQVRLTARLSVPAPTIEAIYGHLHAQCDGYDPDAPQPKTARDLEAALKAINEEKLKTARSFATALETKVRVLEDKAQWAQSFEQGLKIAVDRQKRLLPAKPPDIPGCDVALVYRPAQSVSGDFYDFIDMGQGRVGLAIGDVAGHGIEAGILMGMTKKVLSIRAHELGDAAAALCRANADVYGDLDRRTFVTAFLGVYDPAARVLTYARAGHNPPLLFNRDRAPSVQKLDTGGLMLGMSQSALFDRTMKSEAVQMLSGDVVLLYTDGLEEAKNAQGEQFGLDRFTKVLEAQWGKPACNIVGALSLALDTFCGSVAQEDDVTVICLKVL
ncbi:MAG: PP2C family protein-serine/threonine phosphatase [Planctomycetes bacterium]|nr:PP2C family protein-serine/threonine phosphatase [Planctomycetota bacterium]